VDRALMLRRTRLAAFQSRVAMAPASAANPLKISGVRAWTVREPDSGSTYAVVRVDTTAGISGWGETRSVDAEGLAHARSILEGHSATEFEVLRRRLTPQPQLQAATNMALLDIVGQAAKAPVYQVLGGPTRHKVRVLAPLTGQDDAALLESLQKARTAGFRAFAAPAAPATAANSGQPFALANRKRLESLRAAAGDAGEFVIDCGASLTAGDAASLSAALEHLHPLWLDEPCPLSNLAAIRKIASERVTPLGFGRSLYQGGAFQDLLRDDLIDVFRPDLALNGISQIRRFAALAESNYIAVAPYHTGGPIATAAALHLAASMPNFFIQQIPFPASDSARRFRADLAGSIENAVDGYAALPVGPGLGLKVNASLLGKEVA